MGNSMCSSHWLIRFMKFLCHKSQSWKAKNLTPNPDSIPLSALFLHLYMRITEQIGSERTTKISAFDCWPTIFSSYSLTTLLASFFIIRKHPAHSETSLNFLIYNQQKNLGIFAFARDSTPLENPLEHFNSSLHTVWNWNYFSCMILS